MNKIIETATFAGGCFWGMQELFRKLPGVFKTEVGYCGGPSSSARYEDVKTGRTGHAEALQVHFHPDQISYEDLLKFFFKIHDPTTRDRQGNDIGSQYRSALFYHSEAQKTSAQNLINKLDQLQLWPQKIVTQIVPFEQWHKAEEGHQDYLQKYPDGYTCHFIRPLKF